MKKIFITLYILILLTIAGISFVIGPLVENFYFEIYDVEKGFIEGTLDLIADDLEKLPQKQWASHLKEIEKKFEHSLNLGHLEAGETPVYMPSYSNPEEVVNHRIESFRFYKKIGNTGRVVYMDVSPENQDQELYELMTIFIMFVIPALIWTLLLWKDVLKVQKAADSFGKGNFSVRTHISRFSSISTLLHAFNNMAERIGKLISSHKELTNSVSHELRTPISRIKFGMEMLKETSSEEDRTRYISGIDRDINEIESLVEEMLTYARFDREDEHITLEKHEIVSWLKSIVDIEKSGMGERGKQILLVCREDTHLVAFEPRYMTWAVRNLLRNSCRYTRSRIEIHLDISDTRCSIHIHDDGPGIPEDKRENLFEPFVRLDDSRSRDSGGHGLGLAIVSRISKWHEGSAEVGTSPLGGARFTIQWPVTKDHKTK